VPPLFSPSPIRFGFAVLPRVYVPVARAFYVTLPLWRPFVVIADEKRPDGGGGGVTFFAPRRRRRERRTRTDGGGSNGAALPTGWSPVRFPSIPPRLIEKVLSFSSLYPALRLARRRRAACRIRSTGPRTTGGNSERTGTTVDDRDVPLPRFIAGGVVVGRCALRNLALRTMFSRPVS
jgi:hypothetical protein